MRFRSLGNSGLLVSVAGLGCNNFGGRLDLPQTRAVVDAAIDAGITLFDTADIYGNGGGSEELLGQVLGSRRDQIVLASKFGHQKVDMGYGPAAGAKGGRAYIRRAVENNSLRAMREKEEKAKKSGATMGKGTLLRKHKVDREDARFVRSGSVGGWREKLSDAQIEMVTKYAGAALVRAGYPEGVLEEAPAELASSVRG